MPIPYNFAQTWQQPKPQDQIQREAYSDAVAKNVVQRLPQQNRAEDLALQGAEMGLTQTRRANAQKVAANYFSAIAQSQTPKQAAQAMLSNPTWAQVAQELGLPADKFTIADTDTDEAIRATATDWARALGGESSQRVQSAQVLEDGTIAYLTSDGQLVRTGERARNPQQAIEVAGGKVAFNPLTGGTQPLSSSQQESAAAAERAGAEAWARAAATAGVDFEKERVSREGTLGVWRVAREGLLTGLGGTTTGPFSGRMPAVTARQQIAEGAVAAIAPVLKQLFRSAGEGVFTDRDQQLLIDMIPSRTDLPEARIAKMQMIDAIVEAKLKAPTMAGPGAPPSTAKPGNGPQVVDWSSLVK